MQPAKSAKIRFFMFGKACNLKEHGYFHQTLKPQLSCAGVRFFAALLTHGNYLQMSKKFGMKITGQNTSEKAA
jgi:hypothetical protein